MLQNASSLLKRCSYHTIRQIQMTQSLLKEQQNNVPAPRDEDEPSSATLERIKRELEQDKSAMQWRTPIGDRPEDWNSKLKLFSNTEQTSDYIIMMQKPIDLSPSSIKNWWRKRKERIERHMQQYVPERLQILGPDLAAAHFLLYRGGSVKFSQNTGWLRANEDGEFNLPNKFHPGYQVEGLRCDNMTLYYEGLENLRCLQYLKFLSFHNVKTFDDWCLDRVSGSQFPILEVLDISATAITHNGFSCLYRIPTLKLLIVDNPKLNLAFELSCSMLEEAIPGLKIVGAETVHKTDE